MTNEYERLRLQNIADNKRILAELGFLNVPRPLVLKKTNGHSVKRKRDSDAVKKPLVNNNDNRVLQAVGGRRKSLRLQGKYATDVGDDLDELEKFIDDDDDDEEYKVIVPKGRPMSYGHIPGVAIGTAWSTRIEVNHAGIHRPTVAGIHPGPEGAYSIALSGGYEDDIDLGECFTYTGEGGRDLKGTKANPKNLRTAPQSRDQALSRGNAALIKSVESGQPVRVVRGYKLDSEYAPDEGYRFDGLYKVERWWYTTGLAGYGVYKFALQRIADQAPPPWTYSEQGSEVDDSGVESCSQLSSDTTLSASTNETNAADPATDENSNVLN